MKATHAPLVALAIAALAGSAMATSGSLVQFKPRVLPVVVHVNAKGDVTDILPATRMRPTERQSLIRQLDEWITDPAKVKGQPVASQFIVEVAPQPKTGSGATSYAYVRSMPMPFHGSVHWNVINGGLEVALVSDTMGAQVSFSTSAAAPHAASNPPPSATGGTHPMPTIDGSIEAAPGSIPN